MAGAGVESTQPYTPASAIDPRDSATWRGAADDPDRDAASIYVGSASGMLNFVALPQEEAIQSGSGASSWSSINEECGAKYVDIFTQSHELVRNATTSAPT
jgi:hypothetical protein